MRKWITLQNTWFFLSGFLPLFCLTYLNTNIYISLRKIRESLGNRHTHTRVGESSFLNSVFHIFILYKEKNILKFHRNVCVQSRNRIKMNVLFMSKVNILNHIKTKSIMFAYILYCMSPVLRSIDYWLINYIDTKAKCRHLKKLTCKGILRDVFFRVFRQEIQSVMLVLSTQLCELPL